MGPSMKRRRLDKPPKGSKDGAVRISEADAALDTDFSSWNTEQAYEQRRRKHAPRESTRLPIKTADGLVEEAPVHAAPSDTLSEDSSDDLGGDTADTEDDAEAEAGKARLPTKQAEIEAQEELSKIAEQLQVAPDEHIGSLKRLAQITEGAQNSKITAWALGTQYAVYKDLIPGYRIRPLAEEDTRTKLSKDVKRQRQFEQAIVRGYQGYVQTLSKLAKAGGGGRGGGAVEADRMLAGLAVAFAARLLEAVPHFNFRGDVLRILVDRLAGRTVDAEFTTARKALERLFEEDEDGNASLEAAGMLSKMFKARNYRVDESVLNTFLRLRLLSELVAKASASRVDRPEDAHDAGGKKARNAGWEVRSKKERKLARERKAVEKEMKEADAQVSYEERDRNQSETLKIVFSVYLRVLKARSPGLMGAVLEGLVRYAHLINQDFFGDLLESLRDLVTEAELPAEQDVDEAAEVDGPAAPGTDDDATRNVSRESLLCVITAFALLQGQDASAAASSLHLDLNFFIQHLYRTLYAVSLDGDIELSEKTLRAPDPYDSTAEPANNGKVNVQTTVVLLLRSLQAVLLPSSNPRAVPPVRLAAFAHRVMTSSLQMPHKSATAMLGVMNQAAKLHKKKLAALWNTEERRGDGRFDSIGAEVDGSNPFAGTVWQGELLRLHYAPSVRDGIRNLEKLVHAS